MDWEPITDCSLRKNNFDRNFTLTNVSTCGLFSNKTRCYADKKNKIKSSHPKQILKPAYYCVKRSVNDEDSVENISDLSYTFSNSVKCDDKMPEIPMEVDRDQQEILSEQKIRSRLKLHDPNTIKVVESNKICNSGEVSDGETIESHLYPCKQNQRINFVMKLAMSLLLVIAVLSAVYVLYLHRNNTVFVEDIDEELKRHVYYQEDQIHVAVRTLKNRNFWKKNCKVLGFVGSAGVGKTLTVNIIKKHFSSLLVSDLNRDLITNKKKHNKIISKLYSDRLGVNLVNLVVIDDITVDDIPVLYGFIKEIPGNVNVLFLVVFRIQKMSIDLKNEIHYEDISKIYKKMSNFKLDYEVVVFNELKKENIQDWLSMKFEKQKEVSPILRDSHIRNKLIAAVVKKHDVKYQGMKGLDQVVRTEFDNVLNSQYKL